MKMIFFTNKKIDELIKVCSPIFKRNRTVMFSLTNHEINFFHLYGISKYQNIAKT